VSYAPSAWRTICLQFLTKYSSIPKGRVIIPGCGTHGERNSNQMGAFHDFDDCLLAVHLYNPWDGTSGDPMWWYNQAASEIQPYGDRTIVTEYGQTMTSNIDYMGSTSQDPVVAYLAGLSMYMRDHKMGGTHWVGLRDGDSWSLYKRNGTDSLAVTNPSGLARVKYSWGL
jgi:endoglucanase